MHSVLKSMLTLVAALALATQLAQAQVGPEEKGERIKQFRVAIFTEVLNLTVEEAQGFWPVYNAYLDKREALLEQQKPGRQLDGMNDAEVEDYIKKHFELKQRELDLEKTSCNNSAKCCRRAKSPNCPSQNANSANRS